MAKFNIELKSETTGRTFEIEVDNEKTSGAYRVVAIGVDGRKHKVGEFPSNKKQDIERFAQEVIDQDDFGR